MSRMFKKTMLFCMALIIGMWVVKAAERPQMSISIRDDEIVNKTSGPDEWFSTVIENLKIMLSENGFQVKDNKDMPKALEAQEAAQVLDGMEGANSPGEVAKLEVPAYWLSLTIQRCDHKSWTETRPDGMGVKIWEVEVEMGYSLMDARAAVTVKGVMHSVKSGVLRQSFNSTIEGNLEEQCIRDACDVCIHRLVEDLMKRVPKEFRPSENGRVEDIKDTSKGRRFKVGGMPSGRVHEGRLLEVWHLGDVEMLEEDERVGTLQVLQFKDGVVICREYSLASEGNGETEPESAIQVGDEVRISSDKPVEEPSKTSQRPQYSIPKNPRGGVPSPL